MLSVIDVIAKRSFSELYIYLDIAFLLVLAGLLVYKKKYVTLTWGLFGGLLYFFVDYVFFYHVYGTRWITLGGQQSEAITFWVLMWMSMSYGFTNFVLLWSWLSKKNAVEWTALIFIWWFVCPIMSYTFGANMQVVETFRKTGQYHGGMAIFMIINYIGLIIYNLTRKDKSQKINLIWLFCLGVLVQLGWEATLLLGGIRSQGLSTNETIKTLIINSLLETNMAMPAFYFLHRFMFSKITEEFKKVRTEKTCSDNSSEDNNAEQKTE